MYIVRVYVCVHVCKLGRVEAPHIYRIGTAGPSGARAIIPDRLYLRMASLALQMVPAIGLAACIYLFPESPRWLVDHGRNEEGLETLAQLHANGNKEDPYVQAEYSIIQAQIADEHENAAKSYAELFKNRSNFRRILLACAVQASTQMTGVSAIQYFSPAIFAQTGISADTTLLYQGINSILGELAQFIFFFLIDRVGR